MKPFARKVYLTLPKPSADDPLDDRARLLRALGPETVHMTLAAMQALYPALRADDYRVTATLSPAEHGWTVVRVEPGDTTARFFALALDIGTTTLEMELLHLPDGEVLSRAGCFNGQCALGDNILDRIFYAKDNAAHLHELQTLLLGSIRSLISACCERAAVLPEEVAVLGIGGNTTMIHLLLGCEPWQVFQSPYTPVFLDPGIVPASELALPLCCNVFCMPAVANYLGGDITAGLLMTDMDTRPDLAVFLDVGTNGELALGCRDYLLTGAGAAGPALEGAVSRSGMRAEPGAVCRVRIGADNRLRCETIGGAAPLGICGSGIVDLIAEGYLAGWIAGDGTLDPDASPQIRTVWEEKSGRNVPAIVYAMSPNGPLSFTQDDIAEFVRCKAAAFTMVQTLMEAAGVSLDEVGTFYLSGGFGTHLDLESAVTIGMYPDIPREKFKILGNSSLGGVKKLLLDEAQLARVRQFAAQAAYVQFGEIDKFVENMIAARFLPHTNAALYPSVRRRAPQGSA